MRRGAVVAVVLLAAIGVARLAPAAQAQTPPSETVLVLPFEYTRPAARFAWLREGAALLLADLLSDANSAAVDRDERLRAFDRLQLPAGAVLSRASTIKVGQVLGASSVVSGRFEVNGDELVAHARVIRLETGRLLSEVEARGTTTDVFGVFRRLAQQVSPGAAIAAFGDRIPESQQVFELFVKGLTADTPSTELAFLEQTLKAAPQFDRVRLSLWHVHTEAGDHQRALDAIAGVAPGSRVSRDARFLSALSLLTLKRFDEALRTLQALQDQARSSEVANAMGVVELRRSATPQPGRATYYFSQAKEIDPSNGSLFFNLGYAYWLEHDARATIYWLREAVRRDPGDGDAHFILAAALQQTGAAAEGTRERELAVRLSSKYAAWEAKTTAGGDPVPRGLERLDDQLSPPTGAVDTLLTSAGQRDQDTLAQFHLEAGRRAYDREADREAIQELRRALYLSPYIAEAHLLLGRLFLRGGRTDDAVEALKIALWSEETVAAHLTLAEAYLQAQDQAAARAEVERALAMDPRSADGLRLKAKLGGGPW